MDRFCERLAEILEEDKVGPDDVLTSFEQWDSLTAMSVVSPPAGPSTARASETALASPGRVRDAVARPRPSGYKRAASRAGEPR
jgi:hypothetical protein